MNINLKIKNIIIEKLKGILLFVKENFNIFKDSSFTLYFIRKDLSMENIDIKIANPRRFKYVQIDQRKALEELISVIEENFSETN